MRNQSEKLAQFAQYSTKPTTNICWNRTYALSIVCEL